MRFNGVWRGEPLLHGMDCGMGQGGHLLFPVTGELVVGNSSAAGMWLGEVWGKSWLKTGGVMDWCPFLCCNGLHCNMTCHSLAHVVDIYHILSDLQALWGYSWYWSSGRRPVTILFFLSRMYTLVLRFLFFFLGNLIGTCPCFFVWLHTSSICTILSVFVDSSCFCIWLHLIRPSIHYRSLIWVPFSTYLSQLPDTNLHCCLILLAYSIYRFSVSDRKALPPFACLILHIHDDALIHQHTSLRLQMHDDPIKHSKILLYSYIFSTFLLQTIFQHLFCHLAESDEDEFKDLLCHFI